MDFDSVEACPLKEGDTCDHTNKRRNNFYRRNGLHFNKSKIRHFVWATCGVVLPCVAVLLIVLLINTLLCTDKHSVDKDTIFNNTKNRYGADKDYDINATRSLEILKKMIKIDAITFGDKRDAYEKYRQRFTDFANLLDEEFPHVNNSKNVEKTVINGSLLYKINGSDPNLEPWMILGHIDVVPAENISQWTKHPFGGNSSNENREDDEEEYLYGRGTLDVKSIIAAIFTCLEMKLEKDKTWQPDRPIYIFMGHDEETGGHGGAKVAAEMLKNQNVTLKFIVDEGAFVMKNYFKGIDRPVALIGVAEKGYVSLDVEATADAGHSSMPGQDSSIEKLAKVITRIKQNPFPDHFETGDVIRETFERIAPYTSFFYRIIFSNIWLFKQGILYFLKGAPETQAALRTTTAFTIINGGFKENVMPSKATVTVNHRLHSHEDIEDVLRRYKDLLKDFTGVTVKLREGWKNNATPISPYGSKDLAYQAVKASINKVFKNSIVAPYVTLGGTDSKHLLELTSKIYRFIPHVLNKTTNDAKRIHGIDERFKIKNYEKCIKFYQALMDYADQIDEIEKMNR